MPHSVIIALRIIHIVTGVIWVGGAVTAAMFILPSVVAAGPAGGQVMRQIMVVRRFPVVMTIFMIVTVFSGAALMWWSSAGFTSGWMLSTFGRALRAGAVLAIVAAGLGVFVNKPAAERLQKIAADVQAAGGAPSPAQTTEIGTLQRRLLILTWAVAVLLMLSTVAMAGARYL